MTCHRRYPLIVVAWLLAITGVASAPNEVPLIEALKSGDTRAFASLLEKGADTNGSTADGTTALHWAAYQEAVDAAQRLIRAGAKVNAANRYGATPLSIACTNGNAALIEILLAAGANPGTAMPGGETALMTAARAGSVDGVRALIARGADVNAREATRGQTALMWAAGEGHAEVIKVLAAAGADLRARSHAPEGAEMTTATARRRRSIARIDVLTPLLFAARAGQAGSVRALLAAGADVNQSTPGGMNALVIAIANAHWDLADLLLEHGADPNAAGQGWNALHQAIRTRNLNIASFPHPLPTGEIGSADFVKKLIARGADVNARATQPIVDGYRTTWDQVGATPFLMAAKGADSEMMRMLVAAGADPSVTNSTGTTALMVASGVEMFNPNEDSGTNKEALACVTIALELGADVNAVNTDGDTALHGAAWRGANDIVQLLVDRGATLDVKNAKGFTPLQIANGDEARLASILTRPATVALLQQLLRARGLPADVKSHAYVLDEDRPAASPR